MRKATLGSAAAACATAVALTVTASAFARAGDRTFAETYPVASALCAKAKAGTLPPKLATQSTAVSTACDTLANAYPTLVSTVDAAEATLLNTISAQQKLVAAACPKPVTNKPACQAARATAKSTDSAARTTEQAAVNAYRAAIEANRTTFWNTISALR